MRAILIPGNTTPAPIARALVRASIVIGVVALIGTSCTSSGGTNPGSSGKLAVVVAFYPVQEAAARVGGQLVDITNLTAPGVEPHDLELSPDQVEAIATADVVLYLGAGFQPAVQDAIGDAEGLTVDLLAGLPTVEPPSGSEHGLTVDPHVWLDPVLYAQMVDEVRAALTQAAPKDASTFRSNADAFTQEISHLADDYRAGLSTCDRTLIVTNHAAFGYLAAEYGLTQEAISGLAPDAEPSAQRLAEMKQLVEQQGVTTIFTEDLVSPKVAQTLAEEAGVRTAVLHTIEGLTDQEVAAGDDYVSQMQANLSTLRTALGCS
jgi:ABC-type metal ion transport system, periplasmic component/surface adhesin